MATIHQNAALTHPATRLRPQTTWPAWLSPWTPRLCLLLVMSAVVLVPVRTDFPTGLLILPLLCMTVAYVQYGAVVYWAEQEYSALLRRSVEHHTPSYAAFSTDGQCFTVHITDLVEAACALDLRQLSPWPHLLALPTRHHGPAHLCSAGGLSLLMFR